MKLERRGKEMLTEGPQEGNSEFSGFKHGYEPLEHASFFQVLPSESIDFGI